MTSDPGAASAILIWGTFKAVKDPHTAEFAAQASMQTIIVILLQDLRPLVKCGVLGPASLPSSGRT